MHFSELNESEQLEHLQTVAHRSLAFWDIPADSSLTLLSLSENATYLVLTPEQHKYVLRVHRIDYHTVNAIHSEINWMYALETQAGIATPQAIPGVNNDTICTISTPALNESRQVVLFHWIEGSAPSESALLAPFERLGKVTAQLHLHAKNWQLPKGFERLRWDFEGCLGSQPHWGDWHEAPSLSNGNIALLETTVLLLKTKLADYGVTTDRFGLIHADLRLANLLECDNQTRVIDFDDAGFGWYLYDLASALSFIETRRDVPELIQRWLSGYQSIAPLTQQDLAMIPSFIILRRMTLLAWIGSHPETELAKSQGSEFSQGTMHLANAYLASEGESLWTK